MVRPLGIPAKLNASSGGCRTAFRDDPEHHRSVATLASRLCGKAFGFVKRNLSGAQRRKDAANAERGAGKGAAALSPPSTGETRSAVSAPDIGSKFRLARRSTSTCQKPDSCPRRKRHFSEPCPTLRVTGSRLPAPSRFTARPTRQSTVWRGKHTVFSGRIE
jgi:hypothetical protein